MIYKVSDYMSTMPTPAFLAAFNISDTTPDGPAALPF